MVIGFVIGFATGPGSIPWFFVTELFQQSGRPMATSIAVVTNWSANFLVGLGFSPLQVIIKTFKETKIHDFLILPARIGTVCLHNIHRVASSLYCLCLVQGSGDEKSDHRRNHSTIQTNSILNCIDTKQNVLNVACVQDIAFTPKKIVHQFLEKIK
jgi:hypothetical protein